MIMSCWHCPSDGIVLVQTHVAGRRNYAVKKTASDVVILM